MRDDPRDCLRRAERRRLTRRAAAQRRGSSASAGAGPAARRMRPRAMVCGFCSTGCSLDIHLRDGEAVGPDADGDYPVNLGMACPKGWEALAVLDAPDRATTPLAAQTPSGRLVPVDWDAALATRSSTACKAIQRAHGPDIDRVPRAPARSSPKRWRCSARSAKFGMGMLHGDGNTRQCMATLGRRVQAGVRLRRAAVHVRRLRGVRRDRAGRAATCASPTRSCGSASCAIRIDPEIVVIDPRATETAMAATQHLAAAAEVRSRRCCTAWRDLLDRTRLDRSRVHRRAHDRLRRVRRASSRPYTLERVAAETRLSVEQRSSSSPTRFTQGQRVSFWWTMGVNQSHQGVRTAQAIINLALMTGNIGRPGTGANSITGQCNAMGSRLFSNTTNLLGGHDFENADDRAEVAEFSASTPDAFPTENSSPYHQILEGMLAGKIGAVGHRHQPAHSWINQKDADDILVRLDFLVVQDMYATTETAQLRRTWCCRRRAGARRTARSSTPNAASVWSSSVCAGAGTSARRFSHLQARRRSLGLRRDVSTLDQPGGDFSDPQGAVARAGPATSRGIEDYEMLDRLGGVQWPWPKAEARDPESERRLFEDGQFFHPDGKARFLFEAPRPVPEAACRRYPLTLLTGRGSSSQWHTQTRSEKSAVLAGLHPSRVYLEISPPDAQALGIAPDDWVVDRITPGRDPSSRLGHAHRAARPGIFADALREREPAHVSGFRPVFAATGVQSLRRQRPPRLQRNLSG